MDLRDRSDDDLLSSVTKLMGLHRKLTVEIVFHLAEIEERRLHLLKGFPSMFAFCVNALRFSEGEAFRRIAAARLGRRFPVIHSLLASGEVNLSTLELLRPWLTDQNHEELLAAVAGKGKREVQALIATRFPRPDRPSSIRRARIEPLSEARFMVELTASQTLCEKLDVCLDLMSHANPTRDLAVVIERAVDLLLADLARTRLGKTKRQRPVPHHGERKLRGRASAEGARPASIAGARGAKPSGIARAVRREVHDRDGRQCTYVAEDGRRCEARCFLELDHAVAKALGGSDDATNLRVLCRAHNQLSAELTFGRAWIERSRHLRQKKSMNSREPAAARDAMSRDSTRHELAMHQARAANFEKVRVALRRLGFREAEARKAVATVVRMHDPNESLALEQALREALLVATAA
jgi:hypothetical protein